MVLIRVIVFFLLMLVIPDWYIYKRCLDGYKYRKIFLIPSALLIIGMAVFVALHDSLHDYFGIFLIVMLCVCIPKLVFTIFHLILRFLAKGIKSQIPVSKKNALCGYLSAIPALGIFAYILFGAIVGKEYFQIRNVTFVSPNLPEAFDGYRILQLSDIHSGSWTGNGKALEKAIELCLKENPDLALFTGDLVNSRADELKEFENIFSRLKAKDGVYSVLGNHDYGTYVKWESERHRLANIDSLVAYENRMGWRMLNNEHVIIKRGNDSIAVLGVENSGKPPFPDYADLNKAAKGTEGMFQILMSHDPTHWRREVLPKSDIELMLAGHTHDMQVSLFGMSVSSLIYPEHNGLYSENGRGLYVNIGLGYVLFPMRLGAWPEITVITLKCR